MDVPCVGLEAGLLQVSKAMNFPHNDAPKNTAFCLIASAAKA